MVWYLPPLHPWGWGREWWNPSQLQWCWAFGGSAAARQLGTFGLFQPPLSVPELNSVPPPMLWSSVCVCVCVCVCVWRENCLHLYTFSINTNGVHSHAEWRSMATVICLPLTLALASLSASASAAMALCISLGMRTSLMDTRSTFTPQGSVPSSSWRCGEQVCGGIKKRRETRISVLEVNQDKFSAAIQWSIRDEGTGC